MIRRGILLAALLLLPCELDARGLGIGSMSVVNNNVPAGGALYGGTGSTCNSGANGCLLNDINGKLLAR